MANGMENETLGHYQQYVLRAAAGRKLGLDMGISRRRGTARVSLLAALSIAGTGSAFAQGTRNPNLPQITLSATAQHDSNVVARSPLQAAQQGLVQADQSVRLNANLNLERKIGIFDASLIGNVGYNFYARNTQLNRENIAVQGAVLANLSRCQVSLTTDFRRGQSDLTQVAVFSGIGIPDIRNVETRIRYGAEAGCGGDIGFRPALSVARETGTNSALLRSFSNFKRTDYTASLRYAQPVFGELSLLGTISELENPNRPAIGGRTDGYRSQEIGLRFQREIGANLTGVVQVNFVDLTPRRNVRAFKGVTYSANLRATFADRLQIAAMLARETAPALQSDAAYSVSNTFSLDATYALSDRLSIGAGGSLDSVRFPGAGVLGGIPLNNNKRRSARANVTFRANDRLQFSIDARYTTRDADGTFYDSDNSGVGISVSLAL
jgi:hypothetical protein